MNLPTQVADAVHMAFQLFWAKSIKRVSPGALGMVLRGRPLADDDCRVIGEYFDFATWDGAWLLLTAEP